MLPFCTNNNMRHWIKSILLSTSWFCNNLNIVPCLFNCQIKIKLVTAERLPWVNISNTESFFKPLHVSNRHRSMGYWSTLITGQIVQFFKACVNSSFIYYPLYEVYWYTWHFRSWRFSNKNLAKSPGSYPLNPTLSYTNGPVESHGFSCDYIIMFAQHKPPKV